MNKALVNPFLSCNACKLVLQGLDFQSGLEGLWCVPSVFQQRHWIVLCVCALKGLNFLHKSQLTVSNGFSLEPLNCFSGIRSPITRLAKLVPGPFCSLTILALIFSWIRFVCTDDLGFYQFQALIEFLVVGGKVYIAGSEV